MSYEWCGKDGEFVVCTYKQQSLIKMVRPIADTLIPWVESHLHRRRVGREVKARAQKGVRASERLAEHCMVLHLTHPW